MTEEAIAVYTSDELDTEDGGEGANVELKDWKVEGKKRLDAARQALKYLCEPVPQPHEIEQFLHYFCGDANSPTALIETEPLRISFYKSVVAFVRAYGMISQNLSEVGYTAAEITALENETKFYADVRAAIKRHSGEELDIKPYEADMRHLINTYIQADMAESLGDLSSLSLTELIIETGIHDAIAKKLGKKNTGSHPSILNGHSAAILLFNNLSTIPTKTFQCPDDVDAKAKFALTIDQTMREKAPAGWKGDDMREKQVLNALFPLMTRDREATQAIFEIIKNQPGY